MKVINDNNMTDTVIQDAGPIIIELRDGSRIQISDGGAVNELEIRGTFTPNRAFGDNEGIALVPYSCNSFSLFMTPLGRPATRTKD
jgi:hypothetical protein